MSSYINLDLKSSGISCEESFTFGDKFVESVAWLDEGPLTLESQIFNILDEQYLSETASE